MVETLVQSLSAAKEIGIIKNEQVINIIDSVVQHTNFSSKTGSSSVNIQDSVVQRTNFGPSEDDNRKKEEEERFLKQKESRVSSIPKNLTENGIEFVLIPAGEFMMGAEKERKNELPVHKVTIRKSFYLGKYLVTQKQWEKVMDNNPSNFKGDDLPVEQASWNYVQEFIKKLNQMERTDKYRLPSEAEWEYACCAGVTTRYNFGDDKSKLRNYCWYGNIEAIINLIKAGTHPVGQKKPNPWGLYDMHGNVWEWVQDRWHDDYDGAPSDGSAWEDGDNSYRVFRGGGWFSYARDCRSASRSGSYPSGRYDDLGFRVLRTL